MDNIIKVVICTIPGREVALARCIDSWRNSANQISAELNEHIYMDPKPNRALHHIVKVRNDALYSVDDRWVFLCDDDDIALPSCVQVLLSSMANNPRATVIMGQAQDSVGTPRGFSLACSLINVDRFKMVNWLCPPEGGEDFFTLSTLEARHHLVIREPRITWQVNDDIPSSTRDLRVELQPK